MLIGLCKFKILKQISNSSSHPDNQDGIQKHLQREVGAVNIAAANTIDSYATDSSCGVWGTCLLYDGPLLGLSFQLPVGVKV